MLRKFFKKLLIKNSKKKSTELIPKEQSIIKVNIKNLDKFKYKKNEVDGFYFNISSIVVKDGCVDVMVTFINDGNSHIRIDIENVEYYLFQKDEYLVGDFKLNEIAMGTNDIILKNTVLINGHLVRNFKFHQLSTDNISMSDTIIIKLKINNKEFILKNSLLESSIKYLQVVNN